MYSFKASTLAFNTQAYSTLVQESVRKYQQIDKAQIISALQMHILIQTLVRM